MPNNYVPDNDATAGDPWNTAFLSDRDVSGHVPINFVPHPGVYITPACFGNGTYEDQSFKQCFSNLLASEFRRFVFDIYWDSLSRQFRLCPVEIPPSQSNRTEDAVTIPAISSQFPQATFMSSMKSAPLAVRQLSSSNITLSSSTSSSGGSNTSIASSTSTSSSIPAVATFKAASGTTLYQLGPYQCSGSLGLNVITSILREYIDYSSNTLQARLQYIIINLHAASTIQNPTSPRKKLSGSDLPGPDELLINSLSEIEPLVYTPILLQNERQDLNGSWYSRRSANLLPQPNYFTTQRLSNGDLSTSDGWPNENYVQLQQGWRLLMGYGSIDSQMSDYNYDGDSSAIFGPGYLTSEQAALLDDSGDITTGCFYNSKDSLVSQVNSSWAVSTIMNVGASILGYAADNLTTCGITPELNFTLNNQPASVDYQAYQNFGNQALFSWASGEPKNASEAGQNPNRVVWACALMVANTEYQGHWRVEDCEKKYRVACREDNQPYVWRLSVEAVPYDAGSAACSSNTTFDVPRTGLENLYLAHHARSMASSQRDPSILDGVWINFNSLDVDSCWVTTGVNGTCPYWEDADTIRQRKILVPTIAAFVTLVITALTILVKCNTNRRKSKVRKRGEGGWDYEGVPS